jgi:acetate kinase
MTNTLILNIGSSSIKYALYSEESLVLKGMIDRIRDYGNGMQQILKEVKSKGFSVEAVGHRIVHGGSRAESGKLDAKMMRELDRVSELAPLHNIPELKGVRAAKKIFRVPHVAVFDTAFHQTMPEKAWRYALPTGLAEKYNIRRYGFHGTSHQFVADAAAKLMQRPLSKTKIITCHLGNGCSITAVSGGKSVETSMGFTPLEGLVMGTRSGDIDPAVVSYLQRKEKKSAAVVEDMLNNEAGMKGLCGKNDMRDVHRKADRGDRRSQVALDVFCHRLVKYIGAYAAVMNGVDAIVFTAGIGENAWWIREKVLDSLGYIGLRYSKRKNTANALRVSSTHSKVWVFVIPTDEELMMVREVNKLLKQNR